MKVFRIIDGERDLFLGDLLYFEKSKTFVAELSDNLDEWTAPLQFSAFVKKGIFTIPRDISYLFVKERVVPSNRQNIQSILSTHKLKEYDEFSLLELSKGKCSQDNIYLKDTPDPDDFVIKRMDNNIRDCTIMPDYKLMCIFNNGCIKLTDLHDFTDVRHIDYVLSNKELYASCEITAGGYSITFNDSIDIPSRLIFERSKDTGLTLDNLTDFICNNLLDTTNVCDLLNCTRQNINYLTIKKQLDPLKDANGKLFLKGDVIRLKQ